MHHLPPQVRVQLNEDDYTDLRALAEKADCCTIMLARKVGTVASAVMQDCEEARRGLRGAPLFCLCCPRRRQFSAQRQETWILAAEEAAASEAI